MDHGTEWTGETAGASSRAQLAAIDRSLCVVEFATDGTITHANDNMLRALRRTRAEVVGQHHSMLLTDAERGTEEYRAFWDALRSGEFCQGEFQRVAGDGGTVWLQASYNPVVDAAGRVCKVVKYASDITRAKTLSIDHATQLEALHRSQAVIELGVDGRILAANPVFLALFGYTAADIVGQRHRRLVSPKLADSPEYAAFWQTLRSGEYVGGECERVARDGRTVWLQASYNPVREPDGRVVKIVKVASDITAAKLLSLDHAGQMQALNRSQAIVEFAIDGTILSANALFLSAVGYRAEELIGRHHSVLVAPGEVDSPDYAAFWQRLAAGEFLQAEFRRIAKGGRTIWIQGSYNPVFDADGNVIKVVKFATDVTELVAQRTKFEQLSLVADNTDNSVIITDASRRIQYVNSGFERLTGYSSAEALGRRPGEFLQGPLTDQDAVGRIRTQLDQRAAFYDEILNYTKDGEPYWVSLAINPVHDEQGTLSGFISIQANVTDTKRTALTHAVKLSAIGRMNAIAEWSADGALLSVNQALADWGGITRGAAVGLEQVLSAADIAQLRAGGALSRDLHWPCATGGFLCLDAQLSAMSSLDGGPGLFVMCALDVSERRRVSLQAMEAVQDNADQVGELVTRVRAITSQTNVLALNASIEAARAGEAGRGFAVLAGEVRNLSRQCGDAVQRITSLLESNKERVAALEMLDRAAEPIGRSVA